MKIKILGFTALLLTSMVLLSACGGAKSADSTITIKSVTLAGSLDENYQAVDPKNQFFSTDTIYVSVDVAGQPKVGKLNGKFFYGDQLISEATLDFATVNQDIVISIGEDTFAGFNLSPSQPWPIDTIYKFELYVNDAKFGEYPYQVIQ